MFQLVFLVLYTSPACPLYWHTLLEIPLSNSMYGTRYNDLYQSSFQMPHFALNEILCSSDVFPQDTYYAVVTSHVIYMHDDQWIFLIYFVSFWIFFSVAYFLLLSSMSPCEVDSFTLRTCHCFLSSSFCVFPPFFGLSGSMFSCIQSYLSTPRAGKVSDGWPCSLKVVK